MQGSEEDRALMARALGLAAGVRTATAPNPWVGAVQFLAGRGARVLPRRRRPMPIVTIHTNGSPQKRCPLLCAARCFTVFSSPPQKWC